jgi:DNA-binding transcriptional LysR family regulator
VGAFESPGTRILPELLQDYRRRWPAIDVRLVEATKDDHLLVLVERGELELSFAILPLPDGPFESVELLQDPYVLVLSAGDPRSRALTTAPLEMIGEFPLISSGQGRSVEQLENHLRARGLKPRVVFRSNYNGTVQGLVAAGEGAALTPLLTVDVADPGVTVTPVEGLPPRIIVMVWHRERHRSRASQAFLERAVAVSRRVSRRQRALIGGRTVS